MNIVKADTKTNSDLPDFASQLVGSDLAHCFNRLGHTNAIRADGINSSKHAILCHACLCYTESTATNCVKCNEITTGKKNNPRYGSTNCTTCHAEGRELKFTSLGNIGPYHSEMCMHPLCKQYFGPPSGAYAEGENGRPPVRPIALAQAMNDAKGDTLKVQNKFGPAYGPPATYPQQLAEKLRPSPNTAEGLVITTKNGKRQTRKGRICVGDWVCDRCYMHNGYHEDSCHECEREKPTPEKNPKFHPWVRPYIDANKVYIARAGHAQ